VEKEKVESLASGGKESGNEEEKKYPDGVEMRHLPLRWMARQKLASWNGEGVASLIFYLQTNCTIGMSDSEWRSG
jgi:hypothetical protein